MSHPLPLNFTMLLTTQRIFFDETDWHAFLKISPVASLFAKGKTQDLTLFVLDPIRAFFIFVLE